MSNNDYTTLSPKQVSDELNRGIDIASRSLSTVIGNAGAALRKHTKLKDSEILQELKVGMTVDAFRVTISRYANKEGK